MLKNEFSLGLLNQSTDAMASQLAMWNSMHLWTLIFNKVSGWWQDTDLIRYEINNETNRLKASLNANEMRFQILSNLGSHLEIPLPTNLTVGDLDNLGSLIISKSVSILRNTDKNFRGNSSKEMVSHIMKKMFEDLSKQFNKQNPGTQKKMMHSIMQDLKTMPEDQREHLRKELHVDELTAEVIKKSIITGTLGGAFAGVVSVAGFSAYIFAVKILAGLTALIGITLPFAVYTTLTSMIAFLSNSFILGPAFIIFGWGLTKYANKKIKNGLTPVIITQAIMTSVLDTYDESDTKNFFLLYNKKIK